MTAVKSRPSPGPKSLESAPDRSGAKAEPNGQPGANGNGQAIGVRETRSFAFREMSRKRTAANGWLARHFRIAVTGALYPPENGSQHAATHAEPTIQPAATSDAKLLPEGTILIASMASLILHCEWRSHAASLSEAGI